MLENLAGFGITQIGASLMLERTMPTSNEESAMAYKDDAQSTWDKQQNQKESQKQADGKIAVGQSELPTEDDRSFRERLGGDTMLEPAEMDADDLADAELDSDLDYDTAMGETSDEPAGRDSAA